jgi:hypothetical protein
MVATDISVRTPTLTCHVLAFAQAIVTPRLVSLLPYSKDPILAQAFVRFKTMTVQSNCPPLARA